MNFLNLLLATAPLAHLWSILTSLLVLGTVDLGAAGAVVTPPLEFLLLIILPADCLAVLFLPSGDFDYFLAKSRFLSLTLLAPQHENIL